MAPHSIFFGTALLTGSYCNLGFVNVTLNQLIMILHLPLFSDKEIAAEQKE